MASEQQVEFNVNGNLQKVSVSGSEMLADTLRRRLNLTGTKIGCDEAECGSCTVLVDGEPTLSCVFPVMKAHGKTITTIEGLDNDGCCATGSQP
jgi:aerobic-type carbon monoxide dehydrogenase small subunit (CoxS/CutS family)